MSIRWKKKLKILKIKSCRWNAVIRVNTTSISEMSNRRLLIIGFWDGKSLKLLEMLFQRSDALNRRVLWVRGRWRNGAINLFIISRNGVEMEVTGQQFEKYIMEMKTEGFFLIRLLSNLNGNWSLQYPNDFNFDMKNIINNSQHK